MGGSNSKQDDKLNLTDTLGWKNVETNKMSENNIISKLSPQAVQLIGLLNLSNLSDTESEARVKYVFEKANNTLSEEDRKQFKELFKQIALSDTEEQNNNQVQAGGNSRNVEDDLSETSPFISSEMYENMLGKNKLTGGSKFINDESSTSSTSDDSELKSLMSDEDEFSLDDEDEKHKKKDKKHKKKATSESQSAGSLDYLSSSAHTDGDFSNSDSGDDNSTVYRKKYDSTQNSVEDENSHLEASHSVNTSDINFV